MKLLIALLFLTTSVFGQTDLFDYLNDYRQSNGIERLRYDIDLDSISAGNTYAMAINDTLLHTGTDTYECSNRGVNLVPTNAERIGFDEFTWEYFGIEYVVPNDSTDIELIYTYIKLYTLYAWHMSPKHRAIMLNKGVNRGSAHILIGDMVFKPNYRVIMGKKSYFKKFISHYTVNSYATINLK